MNMIATNKENKHIATETATTKNINVATEKINIENKHSNRNEHNEHTATIYHLYVYTFISFNNHKYLFVYTKVVI